MDKSVLKMDLKDVITLDCALFTRRSKMHRVIEDELNLIEYEDSPETGLYSLEYNGDELWFGTLQEINAVVKSMLRKMRFDMH